MIRCLILFYLFTSWISFGAEPLRKALVFSGGYEPLHPVMDRIPPFFKYVSELYFMEMDSEVTVLMDADYSLEEPGLRMPVAWIKEGDTGRVFYMSRGHNVPNEFKGFPEAKQLLINGCLWASRKL